MRSDAVVDEAAERGGDDEDPERDEEHAAATEEVCRASSQEQEAAVAEDVGADDPLQRARRQLEILTNRGESDADHRHVHGVEKEGAAEHEQHAPRTRAEPRGAGEGVRLSSHPPIVPTRLNPVPERVHPGISTTCLEPARPGRPQRYWTKWPPRRSSSGRPSLALPAATNGTDSRRRELGAFLRSRRERLRPEQAGLPAVAPPPHARTAARGGRSARRRRCHLVHVARAGARHPPIRTGARRSRTDAAAGRARAHAPARMGGCGVYGDTDAQS